MPKFFSVIFVLVGMSLTSCVTDPTNEVKSPPKELTCAQYNQPDKQTYAWNRSFNSELSREEKSRCLQIAIVGLSDVGSNALVAAPQLLDKKPRTKGEFCDWIAMVDQNIETWSAQDINAFAKQEKDNDLKQTLSSLFSTDDKSQCSYHISMQLPCAAATNTVNQQVMLRRSFCKAMNRKETLSTRSRCLASVFHGLGDYSARVIIQKMNTKTLAEISGPNTPAELEKFTKKAKVVVKRYMKTSFSMEKTLEQALIENKLHCEAFPMKGRIASRS